MLLTFSKQISTCLKSADRLAIVGLLGAFSSPSGDVIRFMMVGSSSRSKILFLSFTAPLRIDLGGSDFVPSSESFVDTGRSVVSGSEKVTCKLFSAESSWSVRISVLDVLGSRAFSVPSRFCWS